MQKQSSCLLYLLSEQALPRAADVEDGGPPRRPKYLFEGDSVGCEAACQEQVLPEEGDVEEGP